MKTTFPKIGQAGPALPAGCGSMAEWASAAGEQHTKALLSAVVFFQRQGTSPEHQLELGRAVLAGFLAPLLPLVADSLVLFGEDARAGLLAGIMEDLAHGAALALDMLGGDDDE